MPEIEITERFTRAYSALPPEIRKKVQKAIRLLAEDPRDPSLQTKPIQGASGIFEARINRTYRFTYQRLPGDVLLLRVVGEHDKTLKNP